MLELLARVVDAILSIHFTPATIMWCTAGLILAVIFSWRIGIWLKARVGDYRYKKGQANLQAKHLQRLLKLKVKCGCDNIYYIKVYYLIHGRMRSALAEDFLKLNFGQDAPICWLVRVVCWDDRNFYELGWRGNTLWTIIDLGNPLLMDSNGRYQLNTYLTLLKEKHSDASCISLLQFANKHDGVRGYRRYWAASMVAAALRFSKRLPNIRRIVMEARQILILPDEDLDEYFKDTDMPHFGLPIPSIEEVLASPE